MIGAHDTGKSNYLARLWLALRRGNGLLGIPEDPEHIEYVEELITELRSGRYVGRTDNDGEARDFEGRAIIGAGPQKGAFVEVLVPDVAGELWETASGEREVERQWVERIRQCRGALLFLRFGSKHHVDALNWVTSAAAMKAPIAKLVAKPSQVATQIFLTDMINVLETNLGKAIPGVTPRVAVIVAGWDSIPAEGREGGPAAYVDQIYPMFGGRMLDEGRLAIKPFGTSITGGDLRTAGHRDEYLKSNADQEGYVVYQANDGTLTQSEDMTVPAAWAAGIDLPETD
ncbi:hypothetical protein C3E99_13335 [Sphingopyxis sp. MG]|nr:hypothetical protein C3E99_13335 [Sphingopyxis sp. MG]